MRIVLVAAAGGAAAALGQAPWGLWALALVGYAALLWAVGVARGAAFAAWAGFVCGIAHFAIALFWLREPFYVDSARYAWLAPVALLLMTTGMALFWGAASWFAAWALKPGLGRIWLAVASFLALEALRGHLFGGFPWAMPGHVLIDTPLAQAAAFGGALGLSAMVLGAAAALAGLSLFLCSLPSAAGQWYLHVPAAAVAALAAAALGASWAWGRAVLARPMPPDQNLRLRLVQPNAIQALKWHPDYAELFFRRHLELTAAPAFDGRRPDVVVWPETAVPFFLEAPGAGLWLAAEAAEGAPVILGIQRSESAKDGTVAYFNSLAVIGPEGRVLAVYDKHHLVPFGEYIPLFGQRATRPGWEWLAAFLGDPLVGFSKGDGPKTLDLGRLGAGGLGRVLPLICYEVVFPRHLRVPERADWIVQLTNDAWFGTASGPYQHLALARLRAIEQGLPLVRVANTGISAVIDARGRIRGALPLEAADFLDEDLPAALPMTLYARLGDGPWHGMLLVVIALATVRRLRQSLKCAG